MKKLLLSLLLCGGVFTVVHAQQKFMDALIRPVSGQGTVHVIQDEEITRLVNGTNPYETVAGGTSNLSSGQATTVVSPDGTVVRKMKATGYRIQVYAGGNSRTSRQEAQQMAGKVKELFGNLAIYTHFQSPRWICRVGDFRTYEEANQALYEMRATHQFDEALIVKSVIQITY